MDEGINHDYDSECPHCGHSPTCWRDCTQLGCDDGFMDAHDDDAINYVPGELIYKCDECKGAGTISWCPGCGKGIEHSILEEENETNPELIIMNSISQTIIPEILDELETAKILHPDWPVDIIHGMGIVIEEAGEAMRAAVNCLYEDKPVSELRKELIQTAATCIRMLDNLPPV